MRNPDFYSDNSTVPEQKAPTIKKKLIINLYIHTHTHKKLTINKLWSTVLEHFISVHTWRFIALILF